MFASSFIAAQAKLCTPWSCKYMDENMDKNMDEKYLDTQPLDSFMESSSHRLPLDDILHNLGEHVWDWHCQRGEIFYSASLQVSLGYQADQWRLHIDEWFGRVHQQDIHELMRLMRACIEGHVAQFQFEHRVALQNGDWRWMRVRATCLSRTANGRADRIAGVMLDVHEEKELHDVREANHSFLEHFSKHFSHCALFQFHRASSGRCTVPYAGEGLLSVYGITPIEVANNAALLFDRAYYGDLDALRMSFKVSTQSLQIWRHEYRIVFEQEIRWVLLEAYPQWNEEDDSITWHGMISDISHQKMQSESSDRVALALEKSYQYQPLGLFEMNYETQEAHFDVRFVKDLELPLDMLGHPDRFWKFYWEESIHPDDLMMLNVAQQNHILDPEQHAYECELRFRSRHGDWHWLLLVAWVTHVDANQYPMRVIGAHFDITQFKQEQLELRRLEDILRMGRDRYKHLASESEFILNNCPIGVILVKADKIVRVNQSFLRMCAYRESKEMIGLSLSTLLDQQSQLALQTTLSGTQFNVEQKMVFEVNFLNRNGLSVKARLMCSAMRNEAYPENKVWLVEPH
jgi:PAS domain-containing protein